MASDITISSLSVSTGVGLAVLTGLASSPAGQSCLPYMQAVRVEFYVSATNNRAAASAYDGGLAGIAKISLSAGTYYAWARAVDSDGNFGAYYPVSATGGTSFVVPDATPGPGTITEEMLADGSVSLRVFETGVTPVEYGATLPSTGNYTGRSFMLTTNGKLYRYYGGWTAAVATGDLTGTISTGQLAAGSVTADKILAGAVSAAKISVSTLSAITADIGTVTAGLLQGPTLQTGSSGARIVVGPSNALKVYNSIGGQVASIGTPTSAISPPLSVTSDGPAAFLTANIISDGISCSNAGGGVVIRATSTNTGSNAHAFRGLATSGGHGIVGISNGGGGHAFYAETGGYAPFTGQHDGLLDKSSDADLGDILIDDKVVARDGLDDTLCSVKSSTVTGQRGAIGVLTRRSALESDSRLSGLPGTIETPVKKFLAGKYDRVAINSVGEGQMNVCGLGGDIQKGDFICASEMVGKGQRQNDASGEADDVLKRCTVAKSREKVSFSATDQVKRVAVIYLCG